MDFAANLPYPDVEAVANEKTAAILQSDYAGMESELTAINQYIFQHIVLESRQKIISVALREIAIVEMKHLDLLGTAIGKLGAKPAYISNNRYWNAGNVKYLTGPKEILNINIQGELNAIENYKRHIGMIGQESVKKLLERIILDEELHVKVFRDLLSNFR